MGPGGKRDMTDTTAGDAASIDDTIRAFADLRLGNERMISALAERLGITSAEYRALVFISRSPAATPSRIAEFLSLTPGAMTSLIDRTEAAGLIRRTPNPQDRRSVLLELTRRGENALERAWGIYRGAFASIVPESEVAGLTALFERLALELGARAENERSLVRPRRTARAAGSGGSAAVRRSAR